MKSGLLKKALLSFPVLVLIMLFQNCGNMSSDFSATDLMSTTKTSLACPFFTEPTCRPDEVIGTLSDENNCSYPVCKKDSRMMSCPIFAKPICDSKSEIVMDVDQNGCDFYKCERKQGSNCPLYNRPSCDVNERVIVIKDDYGCAVPRCTSISPVRCDMEVIPQCDEGYGPRGIPDAEGCVTSTCVALPPEPEQPESCPAIGNPTCQSGEVIRSIVGQDGCTEAVCAIDDSSTGGGELTCPVYAPPINCQYGTKIITSSNSCSRQACRLFTDIPFCFNHSIPTDGNPYTVFLHRDGCRWVQRESPNM